MRKGIISIRAYALQTTWWIFNCCLLYWINYHGQISGGKVRQMNLVMPLSRKKLMPLWRLYQLHVQVLGGYFLICKMEILRQVTVTFINTASTIFQNLKPFNSSSFLFYFLLLLYIRVLYFGRDWDRLLLCSPDWPGTHYVDHIGLKFIETCPPLLLMCWD